MTSVIPQSAEIVLLRQALDLKQREVESLQQQVVRIFQFAVAHDAKGADACLKIAQLARMLQDRDNYIEQLESTVYAANLLCEMSQSSR